MKRHSFLLFIVLSFVTTNAFSQNGIQTVKGQVIDQQSELPLIGATIELVNAELSKGAVTDLDGYFILEGVPIGRQSFQFNYLGYEPLTIPNVVVDAGKQVMLEVTMEESINRLNEVVVVGKVEKDRAQNEMATVSSRQFSMEEVNRYSGGRSDVARLAGNFAGVSTADDSRNDIVIRGNSPTGVLWRLEGIPIPSPNHFSTIGTTGGPVSALNTNLLKNSDFMTSAFPSEYGNALSGVFDIGFRKGNRDEFEVTLQMGAITGFEGMVEGPLKGSQGGSFLVAVRKSSVGIAQSLGAEIGTNAVPNYQDISFNIDLGKSKLGRFSFFGIGGLSDIFFDRDEVDGNDLFSADDEDASADSKFGVFGIKNNFILNDNSYIRTILSASGTSVQFNRDRYYNMDTSEEFVERFVTGDNTLSRISLSSFINKKFNSQLSTRAGVLVERYAADLSFESAEFAIDQNENGVFDLISVYDFNGNTFGVEPYVQAQYKVNPRWTLNGGIHLQYNSLNDQLVTEPRLAVNWKLAPQHTLNLGYGLHNQNQPLPISLSERMSEVGIRTMPNKNLEFTRSNHFVLSHDYNIASSWRSKIEVYYQYLDKVPVERMPSSFSMLNVGADFGFPIDKNNLINEGTGSNVGIEFTLEKFFTKGYYVLTTASLFDSKYTGSDGVRRNTAFNNQYVFNLLAGKEFRFGKSKKNAFSLDTKVTTAGGRFYTPVDLVASQVNQIELFDLSRAFEEQYDPYFRFDLKFGFKFNSQKRKLVQSFYVDIQNITDNQNIFSQSYNRQTNEINEVYQIGFFPSFIYKVEF